MEAAKSLEQLSGLMKLRGNDAHAARLHLRAEEIMFSPSIPQISDSVGERFDEAWASKNGLQLSQADLRVVPPAIAALLSLADLYAGRGHYEDSFRVMDRVMELEETRLNSAVDARLAPYILRRAGYLEASGSHHEAMVLRHRAQELHEVQFMAKC